MPGSQAVRRLLVLIAVAFTAVDASFAQRSPSRLKWVYATGATINKSSPAVGADGTIYVGNGGHYLDPTPDLGLHAVTPDGTLKWRPKWKYTIGNYVYSPVLAADGTIYVQDATSTLHALDPDGTLRWKYRFDMPVGDNASRVGVLAPAIDGDGTLYVGADTLYAINPNGTLKWRYPADGTVVRIRTAPALSNNGIVYVGVMINMNSRGPDVQLGGMLWAINRDGTRRWQYAFGRGFADSSPSIGSDGTVYIGTDTSGHRDAGDSFIYAFGPDGTVRWRYLITDGYGVRSSPSIGVDGTLYVGTFRNREFGEIADLLALNPDGTLKWKFNVPSHGLYPSPTIGADGMIFFGGEDTGRVYALYPDGTLAWDYATNGGILESSPALGTDGTLYIANSDGNLFALNTSSAGLADSAWPKFHHDNRNTGSNVPLPAAPTGLGYNAGARTIALFWNAPESGTAVSSYVIDVASKPGMSDWTSVDTGSRDTTFILQTSGAFGQVYYIRVRAKGAAGVGPPSRALIVNPGTDARRMR